MASTYVNDLRLNEMATGDASGSWGTVTNTNLELIGEAFSYGTETIGDADSTLTIADGAADAVRSFYLKITSSVDLTTTRIVTLAPNTVSKVWMIENATTGSQVITIKQGSGATINVPNGQVKMISTDGAGSGGAVLDLLVDVDLTGTTTLVNLDVSGAVDIAGDLTLSAGGDGALRFTAASSVKVLDNNAAALVFEEADNAYMTFVTTDGSEAVKFDKALDINAATQIDATVTVGVDDTGYDVKFFGATTGKSLLWDESADSLIVTGSTSLQGGLEVGVDDTGYDVKFFGATAGAYMLWDESADDLILGGAAGLSVNSTALVTGVLTTTAATVFNGGFASNANSTVGGTLGVTGVVTANAGVVVDNFTLDGTTLALSSGEFVLDVASAINFNSDTGNFRFQDAAVDVGIIQIASSDFIIRSLVSDKDIIFQGNDGGSTITALTLDMSAAGNATFNSNVLLPDDRAFVMGASSDFQIYHESSVNIIQAATSNQDIVFKGNDGGSTITALTLDMSEGGYATFNNGMTLKNDIYINNADGSLTVGYLYNDSNDFIVRSYSQDKDIIFKGNDGGSLITALTLDMSEAGAATFNGNIVIGTAGKGIDFSAVTGGTGTATGNLLDDYEEGTWTPTLPEGGSLTVNAAFYTKIGRQVCLQAQASYTPTNNGSHFRIGGIPFVSKAGASTYSAGSLGFSDTLNASDWGILVNHANGDYLYFNNMTNGVIILNSAFGGSGKNLIFAITYITDS
jgi:hypothetical protein